MNYNLLSPNVQGAGSWVTDQWNNFLGELGQTRIPGIYDPDPSEKEVMQDVESDDEITVPTYNVGGYLGNLASNFLGTWVPNVLGINPNEQIDVPSGGGYTTNPDGSINAGEGNGNGGGNGNGAGMKVAGIGVGTIVAIGIGAYLLMNKK